MFLKCKNPKPTASGGCTPDPCFRDPLQSLASLSLDHQILDPPLKVALYLGYTQMSIYHLANGTHS